MKIGVLALQGDVSEHASVFHKVGVEVVEVRVPSDLEGVSGVVLPGGESTTLIKLLQRVSLDLALKEAHLKGVALWGTCAGMILLARTVEDGTPGQPSLGLMDITVRRNAFGRQVDSFEAEIDIPALGAPPFPGVFIRAPVVESVGDGVEVLGCQNDKVVAVKQENLLATSFHPELSDDERMHRYFIQLASSGKSQ